MIINNTTFLPVRALMEAIGGNVAWDNNSKTTTLNYNNNEIRLILNSTTAYFNNEAKTLDNAPTIINNRTMLPICFIAESFGFNVDWNQNESKIIITIPKNTEVNTMTEAKTEVPVVYMTTNISSESLMKIYEQLGFQAQGNVAIKLSTGEAGNTHYLDPNLIKNLYNP